MDEKKQILSLYFVVLLLELLSEILMDFKGLAYGLWIFKPMLMPILMYWYYHVSQKASKRFDKIILLAFFFSWLGDIFLMPAIFPESIGFLLGLGSFLFAHLMYLIAFTKTTISSASILLKRPHLAIVFLLFGISLIFYLKRQAHPDFLPMEIPVIVYASVIMMMVIMAINRYNKVVHASFKWVLIGALLFMFSDTFIALNKFSSIFEGKQYIAKLIIMPLYAIGQYWIAKGSILQHQSTEVNGNQI